MKFLHERLRMDNGATGHVRWINFGNEERSISSELADFIANEIERYYIPRPRINGEVVEIGQEACQVYDEISDKVVGIGLMEDKGISILLEDHGWFSEDEIKRPTKVFDADGVEIKVGQTRWHIPTGKEVTVQNLGLCKKTAGDSVMLLGGSWVSPLSLTLKEPDSLEKLRDDLCKKDDWHEMTRDDLGALFMSVCDRLTAIMERDA